MELGDVVIVPFMGNNNNTFRVAEICAGGLVSGPAVLVRRNGRAVEVAEMPASDLYFHGFGVEGLRFVCRVEA